jgi:hypothetical protein
MISIPRQQPRLSHQSRSADLCVRLHTKFTQRANQIVIANDTKQLLRQSI